ncbi:MAG: polyribonucleotide nucleotidyltransferase, partial [Cyanobacteria bacterium J06631_2]
MQEFDKSISFDGRDIRLKMGLLAPQAGGSVLVQSGDTAVLVAATRAKGREGIDFLPLTVDYEEKQYAAGRIPGGFFRREGRPGEKAILIARLIDRPIRPLFPQWLRDDIQIVATTLSLDEDVPPDVLAVTGASIAVLLAGIPFQGPMAAVRVGLVGDDFILNPTYKEIAKGDLDIVVAGTPDGIVMVEAGANELPEQDVIEAIDFAYEAIQELIQAQLELIKELGIEIVKAEAPVEDESLINFISDRATEDIKKILSQYDFDKKARDGALDEIKQTKIVEAIADLPEEDPLSVATAEDPKAIGKAFKKLTKKLMRSQIIDDSIRVDGRKLDQVRPISSRVGVLPNRVHGSGLFRRGLT